MMEILKKLEIPLCQPQRIPVKTLIAQLQPGSADKKIIETHIASMKLVSILNEQTIRIRPYKDDEFSYQSIYVFYIELKKDDSIITLSNLIHSAFPEPTILIYQSMNTNYISLAEKRINKVEKDKTVVEEVVLCKISDNITDNQISLKLISGQDLKEYYLKLVTWLYKLKVLSITNIYPEKDTDFRLLLDQYERLTTEIRKLKEEYKKASMMSEKMKIDDELFEKEILLKRMIENLEGETYENNSFEIW